MADVENPANSPIAARAPKNHQTSVASPISPVKAAMKKLDRTNASLRPCLSATLPHQGEAKAAKKEVEPVIRPDQMSMPSMEWTPSSGSISGMIGDRKLIAPVMTNWMPTMAQRVRCQPCTPGGIRISAGCSVSSVIASHLTAGDRMTQWAHPGEHA
jgi:hypothetical protein